MPSSPVNSFALSEHKIAAIVLAAGAGSRMHHAPSKLLLPMPDGNSILSHALKNALALRPLSLIVVVRPDLLPLLDALAGLPLTAVPNHRYTEGMGTSLAAGVSALPVDALAVLVLLGDEPAVSHHIVHEVVRSYLSNKAAITVPAYGDQPGPPTLFSREIFADLLALQGDAGGRQLFALYPDRVCRVPFPPAERPKDIDTPEDLTGMLA